MNRMGGTWRQSAFEVASLLCKRYGKSHRVSYRTGLGLMVVVVSSRAHFDVLGHV